MDQRGTHRARRENRLKWAVLTSLLVRPLGVLTPLLIVPMLIAGMGRIRYGLFETIGALAQWMAMTNAGLGLGLVNRLTSCAVSEDRELARRYISSAVIILAGILAVALVGVTAAAWLVDWPAILKVGDAALSRETRLAVWVACAVIASGSLASIAPAVYAAHQQVSYNNLWDALAKVATLAACFLVFRKQLGIGGAVLATSGVAVAVQYVNLGVLFCYAKPWLRPRISDFDAALARMLLRQGSALLALTLAYAAIWQVDRLILGIILGPVAVAEYAVPVRCFVLVQGVIALVLGPLWPAYGEAWERGDLDWIRRLIRYTSLGTVGIVPVAGLALTLWGDPVIRVISAGTQLHFPRALLWGLTFGLLFRAWGDCRAIFLNAAGKLRSQLVLLLTTACLNIVLLIALSKSFGITGAAWAYPVSALFTTAWAYPWLVRRFLRERASARQACPQGESTAGLAVERLTT